MKVSLKKGQEFWLVTSFDGLGKMHAQKLVCEACGEKILRATKARSGEFIKVALQQRLLNTSEEAIKSFHYEHVLPADCDIEKESIRLANLYIEYKLSHRGVDASKLAPSVIYA